MQRLNFVVRRLALLAVVLPAVSLVTFTVSHIIPGDPIALIAGPTATESTRRELRQAWGLDQPLPTQYLIYLGRIARGDLGLSIRTGQHVATDFATFFPATLELATAALLLGIPLALAGGIISAVRRDTLVDYAIRSLIGLGISLPVFWFGIVLILVFSAWLQWLPSVGRLNIETAIPPAVTGWYVLDALLAGQWGTLQDAVWHLVLPASSLAITVVAPIARIARSSVLSAMQQDYVRTAFAKGLAGHWVLLRHVLRNALLPIITSIGLAYGLLLGGAVVTETVFSWPGIGFYVTRSILSLDFQPVMSFALVSALVYVLINLGVDVLYSLLDPRV